MNLLWLRGICTAERNSIICLKSDIIFVQYDKIVEKLLKYLLNKYIIENAVIITYCLSMFYL